jgi:hypothetical protein
MIFYNFKFDRSRTLIPLRTHKLSVVTEPTGLDKMFCAYYLACLYCLSYDVNSSVCSWQYVRVNYSAYCFDQPSHEDEYYFYVNILFFRFCSLPSLTWVTRAHSDVPERRYKSFNAPYSEYVFNFNCQKHFCSSFS